MDCLERINFSIEYGWILSRTQDFRKTEMFQDVLKNAVEKYGFKAEKSIKANQDDCDFVTSDY